jgi:hypothetical protein
MKRENIKEAERLDRFITQLEREIAAIESGGHEVRSRYGDNISMDEATRAKVLEVVTEGLRRRKAEYENQLEAL